MSETNGTKKQLSHREFYCACEMLKKNKPQFLDERPTHSEAAAMLAKMCGFAVGNGAIRSLQEATGIKWESRRKSSGSPSSARSNAMRTLTIALYRLYRKLGEECPAALQDLYAVCAEKTETVEKS